MRDRPGDIGLRPFGDEATQPLPAPPPNNAPIMAAALGTLRHAAKTRVFWILFATFFIRGASTNGLIQVHLIPMRLDFGIPQVQAASLSRTVLASYLPAFFIAGALCVVAALIVLSISRQAKPVAA